MSVDSDGLPPSASRRSFVAGVSALAGMTAFGRTGAATQTDEQRANQRADADADSPMNLIDDLDQHESLPETVTAVSVAQMNSREKYEYRQDPSRIILDRALYSEVRYPGDYGFVSQTAMEDGDPLDVLVLLESSLFPGCVLDVRPVAVVEMTDAGKNDDKIIGVPADDPRFAHVSERDDIPQHHRDEIAEFFRTYKNLEPEGDITVSGFAEKGRAYEIIDRAHRRWKRMRDGESDGSNGSGNGNDGSA